MARERKREDRLREAIVTAGQDHRRVVDVALERTEHTPLARGTRPTPMNVLWVDRRTVLRRGARYHLAVHIGAKGIGSLVVGPQPDINQLMPQGSPSKVDVAVFADGFTVEGRNTAELAVPAFGASRPVVFPVRADGPGSQARLRVAVYRENHLLQSYVLRASIADEERRSRTNKLTVELEFSRTAGYSNLEELKPRTLAIGVNDNGDGTHQLMLKRTGGAIAIELPAAVVEKPVQDVRSILDAATYLDRQRQVARYPARVATNAEAEAVFDKTIRELAVVGRNLYRGMFIGRSRSTETLRLLRAEANHTIQVVRHDRGARSSRGLSCMTTQSPSRFRGCNQRPSAWVKGPVSQPAIRPSRHVPTDTESRVSASTVSGAFDMCWRSCRSASRRAKTRRPC